MMRKTRKEGCFDRWDERYDEIAATQRRLLSSGLGFPALMREIGIRPREQKWFEEWVKARQHPPMTRAMRRHTSLHEASHAVASEMLSPGSVDYAICYKKEQRKNPHFGKDGHPHAEYDGYVRGNVEYVETQLPDELSERKDVIEFLAHKIARTRLAGIMEEKFGFQSGTGTRLDNDNEAYYIGFVESNAEKDAILCRAGELVTQLVESPLLEPVVQEVADRMYHDEVVSGADIRAIVAEKRG